MCILLITLEQIGVHRSRDTSIFFSMRGGKNVHNYRKAHNKTETRYCNIKRKRDDDEKYV